jgi:MFS family permease
MQVESDPEVRGRVMALYFTVLAGGTPLGSPVIGWIGAHLGPRWCLFVGGAMVLVGVAIAVLVKRYAEARIARANAPVTRGTGDLVLDLSAD